MDPILYEMGYCGVETPPFHMDVLTSSLLDDDDLLALRKEQGDVYNLEDPGQDDHLHDNLFPDLLPWAQDHSDPLSLDWMEAVDLSHFVENSTVKSEPEYIDPALPITVQPEDIHLLQSLLQDTIEQPVSPPAQVAPEIDLSYLDFDHAWDVINSPHDIERVLTPDDIDQVLTPESWSPATSSPSSPGIVFSPDTSNPSSPASVQLSTIDSSPLYDILTPSPEKSSRRKPYERSTSVARLSVDDDLADLDFSFRATEKLSKRERKKLQNKNAATKYRQKKKQESVHILTEEQQLEKNNQELHDKVEQLTREISCMKDVLGDIYKGLEAKSKMTM